MTVELSAAPNPDFTSDDPKALVSISAYRREVASLQEASRVCLRFIEANDLGGGNWTGGAVYEGKKQVAKVSYNGRVWAMDGSEIQLPTEGEALPKAETSDETEIFRLVTRRFNVTRAKEILAAKKHKVDTMEISGVAPLVGEPGKMVMGITVDWNRVHNDPCIDLEVPVILFPEPDGSCFPIDGWHRIARAKITSRPTLPCVLLTKKEAREVEIL